MIKRILILTIALFVASSSALGQQECPVQPESPVLKYNFGRLTLECGDGELFCLGGGHDANKQGYSKIYYLFTNDPKVYISNDYRGSRYNHADEYRYKLAIQSSDQNSRWSGGGTMLRNRVLSSKEVQASKDLAVIWEDSARILFDTKDDKNTDVKYTVALIVLPVPPRDTFFTTYKLTDKHIKDGILTANLQIGRTGRIVFDSIWIDSVPQHNVTYNDSNQRDMPYYRCNPHANIAIDMPVSQSQRVIYVTVFYRLLSPDGKIISQEEVLVVPIRFDFPFIPVLIVVVLIVCLVLLLRWIFRKRKADKPHREARRAEDHRLKIRVEEQKKRIRTLENQLESLKKEVAREREETKRVEARKDMVIMDFDRRLKEQNDNIDKLKSALREAQNKEYTAEDSAEFRQRCNAVVNEIDMLYNELIDKGGNMPTSVVAEKVRQLERRICIMQNK